MNNDFFPGWFRDQDIQGRRAITIMQKFGLSPDEQFGRIVIIEILAARLRERENDKLITNPWGLFVSFCIRASGHPKKDGSIPEPLFYSAAGEKIREALAKRGEIR